MKGTMSTAAEIEKFAEARAYEIATEENSYAAGVNGDDVAYAVAEDVAEKFSMDFWTAQEIADEAATIVDVIQNS